MCADVFYIHVYRREQKKEKKEKVKNESEKQRVKRMSTKKKSKYWKTFIHFGRHV